MSTHSSRTVKTCQKRYLMYTLLTIRNMFSTFQRYNTLVLDTLKNGDIFCISTNFLVVFLKINGEMWVTVEVDGFIELFCSSVIKFIGKFFVCKWNTPTKSNGFDLVHM